MASALDSRNFSSQHEMDRWAAEQAALAEREQDRHDRVAALDAKNAALLDDAERSYDKAKDFNWLTLTSIDDHPDVTAARMACDGARQSFADAQVAEGRAQAALDASETSAARGRRDDAALTRAQAGIERAESNLRIAAAAVTHTEQELDLTRRRVEAAAAVSLRTQHRAAIRAMDAALGMAADHSNRAAELEDASTRLLRPPSNPHARPVARPLPVASWRRQLAPRGVLSYWRRSWRDLLA